MQTAITLIENEIRILTDNIKYMNESIKSLKLQTEIDQKVKDKLTFVLTDLQKQYTVSAKPSNVRMESYRHYFDNGQKIEAIKKYRQEYDVGLKEAKDALENYFGQGHWNAKYIKDTSLGDILGARLPY